MQQCSGGSDGERRVLGGLRRRLGRWLGHTERLCMPGYGAANFIQKYPMPSKVSEQGKGAAWQTDLEKEKPGAQR